MAETVGVVASIVQIAGAGATLSKSLYNFVGSVARADQDIGDIAGDIGLTVNALNSVGEVFANAKVGSVVSKRAIQDANDLIKRCEAVFLEISKVIDKGRKTGKDGTKGLSTFGKLSWPLKEQRVELLRKRLDSLKHSLVLLLHVLQLASIQDKERLDKSELEKELTNIRQLYKRQQESLTNLQALEANFSKVNLSREETPQQCIPTPPLPASSSIAIPPPYILQITGKIEPKTQKAIAEEEEEDGRLTIDQISRCTTHIQNLLRRVSNLQSIFEDGKSLSVYPKRPVWRSYRQFCHNFEDEITLDKGEVTSPIAFQHHSCRPSLGYHHPFGDNTTPAILQDENEVAPELKEEHILHHIPEVGRLLNGHAAPFLQPHPSQVAYHPGPPHALTYTDIEAHPSLHQSHILSHPEHPQPSGHSSTLQYQSLQSRKQSGPSEPPTEHLSEANQESVPTYGTSHPPINYPQQHHHRLSSNVVYTTGNIPINTWYSANPYLVGQPGMPSPALRPRGPKLQFTAEDDQLLVNLKEKKNLTWKQIADFFPGRSSGTLQVRYCTKLKARTTVWNEEMVQKLHNAIEEYENDRWRIISSKVGNGFSPAACRDKAAEEEAASKDGGTATFPNKSSSASDGEKSQTSFLGQQTPTGGQKAHSPQPHTHLTSPIVRVENYSREESPPQSNHNGPMSKQSNGNRLSFNHLAPYPQIGSSDEEDEQHRQIQIYPVCTSADRNEDGSWLTIGPSEQTDMSPDDRQVICELPGWENSASSGLFGNQTANRESLRNSYNENEIEHQLIIEASHGTVKPSGLHSQTEQPHPHENAMPIWFQEPVRVNARNTESEKISIWSYSTSSGVSGAQEVQASTRKRSRADSDSISAATSSPSDGAKAHPEPKRLKSAPVQQQGQSAVNHYEEEELRNPLPQDRTGRTMSIGCESICSDATLQEEDSQLNAWSFDDEQVTVNEMSASISQESSTLPTNEDNFECSVLSPFEADLLAGEDIRLMEGPERDIINVLFGRWTNVEHDIVV